VQGAAENGGSFDRDKMNHMLDLAVAGCGELMRIQREAFGAR
jgi:ribonuclease PH